MTGNWFNDRALGSIEYTLADGTTFSKKYEVGATDATLATDMAAAVKKAALAEQREGLSAAKSASNIATRKTLSKAPQPSSMTVDTADTGAVP